MTDLTPTQILDDELNMQNLEAELSAIPLDEVTRAIKDIADGRPVIVARSEFRRNVALMQPNQGQNARVFFAPADCDKSQVRAFPKTYAEPHERSALPRTRRSFYREL